ncbi:MAG: aspartate-semialdehyde dehydrogenase [bacterium]|nr:aspartate-semialdehyde dehydrogenase [bacterium]
MSEDKKQEIVVLVGATGLVGTAIVRTLERFPLPVNNFIPLASLRSKGKNIQFRGKNYTVREFDPKYFKDARWVFFSGKDGLSEEFCPVAASEGAWVIDNSASFRMNPDCPLVVPEINLDSVGSDPRIIANPNCSSIQLAVILAKIRDNYGLERVIVSTYQSASGAGGDYLEKLINDSYTVLDGGGNLVPGTSLAFNCIPAVGTISENYRFSEETKLENEVRKILELDELKISATAVRVPTLVGHGESVVVETSKPVDPDDVRKLLAESDGVKVLDDIENRIFPTPRQAENTDPVWVGRIRKAGVFENDLAFWVVADNLLKGAALNAVQIAVAINKRDGN